MSMKIESCDSLANGPSEHGNLETISDLALFVKSYGMVSDGI